MKVRAFITHKKAEHFQDCQDRFSVNCGTKSLALSDGMSQSIFQTIWAEILVNAYTKDDSWNPNAEKDLHIVKDILSAEWKIRVKERIQQMQNLGKNTTRTENSLAVGLSAGATLVGIRFDGDEWHGDVLGDSCLIEIQDSKIKDIYTSQDSETFDNNPDYYDSNPLKDGKGEAKPIYGKLSSGMTILLVSDPFSDFLSEKKKLGEELRFVKEILDLQTHNDFENLVSRWRSEYGMHNDDSTLIIVEPDETNNLYIVYKDDIEQMIKDELSVHNESSKNSNLSNTQENKEPSIPKKQIEVLQQQKEQLELKNRELNERNNQLENENKNLQEKLSKIKEKTNSWYNNVLKFKGGKNTKSQNKRKQR